MPGVLRGMVGKLQRIIREEWEFIQGEGGLGTVGGWRGGGAVWWGLGGVDLRNFNNWVIMNWRWKVLQGFVSLEQTCDPGDS